MSTIVLAAIRTALTDFLPSRMDTPAARLMMLTIQKQEDPEERRYQVVKRTAGTLPENIVGERTAKGPARSLWQFEAGGGIKGVLTHRSSAEYIGGVCEHFAIPKTPTMCWRAVEDNDVLAACFARLLLWTDSGAIPKVGEEDAAAKSFDMYLRTWRPGAFTNGTDAQQAALEQKFLRNYAAARKELNIQ